MIVGESGPAVVLDARTCAWLEQHAGLSALRVRVRGTDPAISAQLEQIHHVGLSWHREVVGVAEPAAEPVVERAQELSTEQAGRLLGMTSRGVLKAIHEGRLQAVLVGNRHRIARVDVEHFKAVRAAPSGRSDGPRGGPRIG